MERSPRQRFELIARQRDEQIDLGEAALVIAAEEYPELDIGRYLARLDALAELAAPKVAGARSGGERIERLNRFLFVDQGFTGNQRDYYDSRNSFLNEVLDRRIGIPLTLSVVYMEVARRLGIVVHGVCFPGHFLTKFVDGDEIIIDAFSGRVLSAEECRERLQAVLGQRARLEPSHLRAATCKEILVRMLGNLKQIYIGARDFQRALSCCDRILLLAPDTPRELRDRGLVYHQLECHSAALSDLEHFLALDPDDDNTETIRTLLIDLRREVAHIN